MIWKNEWITTPELENTRGKVLQKEKDTEVNNNYNSIWCRSMDVKDSLKLLKTLQFAAIMDYCLAECILFALKIFMWALFCNKMSKVFYLIFFMVLSFIALASIL